MFDKLFSRRSFLGGAAAALTSVSFTLASGPAKAFAGETGGDTGAGGSEGKIAIVHTNDVHCGMYNAKTNLGYSALVDFVSTQKESHAAGNVTLVDAGDAIQGGVLGAASDGKIPMQVEGACDYDVVTVGNHEFDFGVDNFLELVSAQNRLKYVCCNFTDASGTLQFDPYHVIEYNVAGRQVKVAYLGAVTPTTLTRGDATLFQGEDGDFAWDFLQDDPEVFYATVQMFAQAARSVDGADYVVLLSHLGEKDNDECWRSDTLVAKTCGIDLVVDGHSHEKYVQTVKNADGQDVVIAQTGTKFASFGHIEIDPATGEATASLDVTAKLIESWDGQDEKTAALIAQLSEGVEPLPTDVIGTAEVNLYATPDDDFGGSIKNQETNLGDLVCDGVRAYYEAKTGKTCDLAIVNAAGVKKNIRAGKITYAQLLEVEPYCNQMVALEVSGQYILDLLEAGATSAPEDNSYFLQVSDGTSYTIRTDIPTPVVFDASKFKEIGSGERRVKNAQIGGQAIDPAGRYTVASSDFVLTRANKTPVPENAAEAEKFGFDVIMLVDYIRDNLKGVVGAGYEDPNGAGRITITDHEEVVPETEAEDDPTPGDTPQPTPAGDTTNHGAAGGGTVPATGDQGGVAVAAAAALGAGALLAAGAAAGADA